MGGIINYVHGERGVVRTIDIERGEDGTIFRVMNIDGDPFRTTAFDYNSDIRISPTIVPGDDVCFVRLDTYCGAWVRWNDRHEPALTRDIIDEYVSPGEQLEQSQATCIVSRKSIDERAALQGSVFLSHSSWGKLLARFVRHELTQTAKVDVWLDEEQAESVDGNIPIEQWLKRGVDAARGFVVLWNHTSSISDWVKREIAWAIERRSEIPIIALQCDRTPLPSHLERNAHVVSVDGLWYAQGIAEEVFTTIHGLEPRSVWISENERRGHAIKPDPPESVLRYVDLISSEGHADTDVEWRNDNGHKVLSFRMRNRQSQQAVPVYSSPAPMGGNQRVNVAVDAGIRKGDRVGRIATYRASRFAWSCSTYWYVWMRIDVPGLTAESVVRSYVDVINGK